MKLPPFASRISTRPRRGNFGSGPSRDPAPFRCPPPQRVLFTPDWDSSLLWYDALGQPKRYAPSVQLPNGEWAYALSPRRFDPPLRDDALAAHLTLVRDWNRE